MFKRLKCMFVYLLLAVFAFAGSTATVQAAMIGTEQVWAANTGDQARARLAASLERPEVMAQLEKMGVSKPDAQARVAALTDSEAVAYAQQIDSLPAGGDVVGALVLIFVILLVTDILGLTHVFPFTRSRR